MYFLATEHGKSALWFLFGVILCQTHKLGSSAVNPSHGLIFFIQLTILICETEKMAEFILLPYLQADFGAVDSEHFFDEVDA